MFYLLAITIVAMFVIGNNKRIHNKLFYIALAVMAVLMGGNTNNPDTGIYYDIYYSDAFFEKDVLFGVLVNISKYIGLDVDQFRFLICLTGLCLIYTTVLKYTKSPWLFTVLYLSVPFFYDVIQLRNFLGWAIIIYALPLMLCRNGWKKLFAVLLFLAAALIQKVHLIFPVLLILAFWTYKNKYFRYVFFSLATLISFVAVIPTVSNAITWFLNQFDLIGLKSYSNRSIQFGWAVKYALHFLNCLVLWYIKGRLFNRVDGAKRTFLHAVYYLNFASTVCLCLYTIDSSFARILRNTTILVFIVIAAYFQYGIFSDAREQVLEILALVVYLGVNFYFYFLFKQPGEGISYVTNVFQHNWILFGDHSTGMWLTKTFHRDRQGLRLHCFSKHDTIAIK